MSATSSTFWFWSDWLGDPAVRRLTPAARGVWIDCLALAATANPIGYLCDEKGRKLTHEEIARVCNATPVEVSKLLKEILDKGVASTDRTGRIYNRRMVRKADIVAKKRLSGKLGGAATRLKWQQNSADEGQTPRHLPQHNKSPPSYKKDKTSSLPSAAREEPNPAGGPATAPLGSAPSRPPGTTNGEAKGQPRKEVKEARKSDLPAGTIVGPEVLR